MGLRGPISGAKLVQKKIEPLQRASRGAFCQLLFEKSLNLNYTSDPDSRIWSEPGGRNFR